MTDRQHDLIKRLSLTDCYLVRKETLSGNEGWLLCDGNMNPVRRYAHKTVKDSVLDILKTDGRGRYTLNKSLVRRQHGKSLLKIFYNQKNQKRCLK